MSEGNTTELYGVDAMPDTAENVADEYKISRADQDKFALATALAENYVGAF